MNKKIKAIIFVLFLLVNKISADIMVNKTPVSLTKDNFIYVASSQWVCDYKYYAGTINIKSIGETRYSYTVPIYAVHINDNLEADVQWVLITKMEFKDDQTIVVTNGRNYVFEFNINTYEVTPVNCETQIFGFDIKTHKTRPVAQKIKGQLNRLFESENKADSCVKKAYDRIQPEQKKLTKIEDVISVAEKVLFPIFGEEKIKGEQPYNIFKYKNKWIVNGSLPEGWDGGTFEIIINADTSKIESLIHYK